MGPALLWRWFVSVATGIMRFKILHNLTEERKVMRHNSFDRELMAV